jgi:2-methylcitrate dehydratase PrpD
MRRKYSRVESSSQSYLTRRGFIVLGGTALFGQVREPSALKLARIVNSIRYESLTPVAEKHAKMILASTLASAAAGSAIESVKIVRDLAKDEGGKPEATLWFDRMKLPVTAAARVNAMQSDASASDDSDLRNVAHIGTCLTAVGLAMGERVGASGKEFLAAMVAGYEAAGRIGEALAASSDGQRNGGAISGSIGRGFHASAIVAFGGTVAAGRLLKLNDEQMAQAISTTATTVGGLSISTNSWAREYHAGNAALTAVNSALAASRGYAVNPDMLESSGGFLRVFAGGTVDARAIERELNGDYQIARYLAVKLLPGAHALHPAVEAAVNAVRDGRVKPDDVAKILVAGPQSELAASSRAPKDTIEAIHSLPYYVASAVADRDFSWKNADPEMIKRPEVIRLIGVVEQGFDAKPYQWPWGARVDILTKSGQSFSSTVDAPRGSAPRGIEWRDIDAKYRALMVQSPLTAARREQALNVIHDFESLENVGRFANLLAR